MVSACAPRAVMSPTSMITPDGLHPPGFANFITDARSALRVSEAALVVVDAVSGVEVQTEKLWEDAAGVSVSK